MSDRLSRFLQSEIDQINSHLPQKSMPLKLIDRLEKPGVKLRDGGYIRFDNEELSKIKEMIPKQYWGHVLLPIIITRRRDLGPGAFKVGGSEANQYIIQSLFDELPSFSIWRVDADKSRIFYKPEIRIIRKKYPTTSILAFA